MAAPYELAFAGLVLVYLFASYWARLDPRWPVAGTAALVVAIAVASLVGNVGLANTLAPYALLLLGGAVVLLLVTPEPAASPTTPSVEAPAPPRERTDQRDGPAQEPLDDLQQQPVALVDRTGQHDGEDEQPRDRQPDHG